MPATEAQIRANRANALKSTGPRTPEGKASSRANAYKHGLTGSGTVLPEREAAEVERRTLAYWEELNPSGEVGDALVRRMATLSTRMERCVTFENAALTDRVRRAEAEFVAPEGVDEAEAARLRTLAGHLALFDASKEASLARKYEAAAERGFFRALKELRQHEKAVKAAEAEEIEEESASFFPDEMTHEAFDARYAEVMRESPPKPRPMSDPVDFSSLGGRVDVPITVGRRR